MPNLERSAMWYARRGWRVLPVKPKGKTPLIKDWPNLATTDISAISRWWREYPDANVGLSCGPGSDLYVIDIDQHGDDGEATIAKAIKRLGPLPPTVEQRTGSGGRQLLFRWPEGRDMRNKVGNRGLGPGVDTRAAGGYIVTPPSIHPCGERYVWTIGPHQATPADLPERWAKALERKPEPKIEVTVRPLRHAAEDPDIERIFNFVAKQGKGNRNDALYWAARKIEEMRRLGLVAGSYDAELYQAALQCGLGHIEAQRTISSARRAGGGT